MESCSSIILSNTAQASFYLKKQVYRDEVVPVDIY